MQRPWAGLGHRLLGLQGSALVGRVSSPAAPRLCPWIFTPHTLSSLFSWPPRPPFLQASSSGVFHSLHGAFHPNRCSQSPCHMTWTQIIQAGSTYCPRRRVTLSNWAPCTCHTGPCLPRPERGQVSINTRCTSSCRAGPSLRRGRVCFLARLGRAAAEGPRLLPRRPQPFRFSFPQREAAWPAALGRGSSTPGLLPSAARRKRRPERGPLEANRRWDANHKELLHLFASHTASRVASRLWWAAGPAWLPLLSSGPGWTSGVLHTDPQYSVLPAHILLFFPGQVRAPAEA